MCVHIQFDVFFDAWPENKAIFSGGGGEPILLLIELRPSVRSPVVIEKQVVNGKKEGTGLENQRVNKG